MSLLQRPPETQIRPSVEEVCNRIGALIPPDRSIYLVGGAVRDLLRGVESHDLDFVMDGNTKGFARRVADELHGAFYMLDEERQTARVILDPSGTRLILDFALMRGSLHEDLLARDFTVNAIAMDLKQGLRLMDPLDGAGDLRRKLLQPCRPQSFEDDPVRILRGVRLAVSMGYHLEGATLGLMQAALPGLGSVSPERRRDEVIKILSGRNVATAIRLLDALEILDTVLPDLKPLKGLEQREPHVYDAWEHTLAVIRELEQVISLLADSYNEEKTSHLSAGLVTMRLGRYREQFKEELERALVPDRALRPILFLAALYHDAGKPARRTVGENGVIHFYEHEVDGAKMARRVGLLLALSNDEIEAVDTIIQNHMRIHLLANAETQISRRTIYRFFRAAGSFGPALCLLSLADLCATYGPGLPVARLEQELDICRLLLEACWEHPQEAVHPPRLVSGEDLIHLGFQPGPAFGAALRELEEAQAVGEVADREQALDFCIQYMNRCGIIRGEGD